MWVGLNPRPNYGDSKSAQIKRQSAVLVDIDYHHEGTPATDAEIEQALEKAGEIAKLVVSRGHPAPYVDVSGNGVHLVFTIDIPIQNADIQRDRVKAWYKTLGVEVDEVNADLARMCRVPGTFNTDANRMAYIFTMGDNEVDKVLSEYLKHDPKQNFTSNEAKVDRADIDLRRFNKYRAVMRPCLKKMLTNENPGAVSKKGHLAHEAHLCLVKDAQYAGLSETEICALFVNQPDYKKKETDDYVHKLILDNNKLGTTPWYCPNLIERGWCLFEDPELCMAQQSDPSIPKTKKPKENTEKGAVLLKLAKENAAEFFRDQYKTGYAVLTPVKRDSNDGNDSSLEKNGLQKSEDAQGKDCKTTVVTVVTVTQTVPINSREFQWWIAQHYNRKTGDTVSKDTIRQAALILEAETQNQPIHYLYNRMAPDGSGGFYLDMCDARNQAIHASKNGWSIEPAPTKVFRRYAHMMPLPEPDKTGNLEPFLDYLNVSSPGDKLLAVAATITGMLPEVPRVGTVITGQQGSGKSTFHRLEQNVLDPSSTDLLTLPTKDDDLVQILDHHAVAIFDNVNTLTRTQSDILCRAITGVGTEKRELYTTDDSFIRSFMRKTGLNGISMPVEKSDLFSRLILLPWEPVTERKTDAEMKTKIQRDAPGLIGAMLNVLVEAMKIYDETTTTLNVRMSDFAKMGCAITKVLGFPQSVFENAYKENIRSQDEEAAHSSLVAEYLLRYMDHLGLNEVSGSASELKEMIEDHVNPKNEYSGKREGDLLSRREGWPKNHVRFGRELTEVAPALRSLGYYVSTPAKNRGRDKRNYTIIKRDADPTTEPKKGQQGLGIDPEAFTDEKLRLALRKVGGAPHDG